MSPGRSVLIPTKREVALMLFSLAGGVWLWASFVDWLNTRHRELAADVERTRPQAVIHLAATVKDPDVIATKIADAMKHMRGKGVV